MYTHKYALHFAAMFLLTIVLFLCDYGVSGLNFDVSKVIEIKLGNGANDTYFGYSLLLQTGRNSVVIVGAPKFSSTNGGGIFRCDVNETMIDSCSKYSVVTTNIGSSNGNFLGAAIDGDDVYGKSFTACAPRKVNPEGGGINKNNYLKGSCFYHRNSSNLHTNDYELTPLKNEASVSGVPNHYYYNFAFGQAGIDVAYNEDESSLLLGAIGIKNWNGAIVKQSLKVLTEHKIVPQRSAPSISETYDYLGYKVGYATLQDSQYIFAGAPRAEDLLGKVKLYNDYGLYKSFKGEELGAYFGSAVLAVDVNGDGSDDLFVGAPMTARSTYDEGCVYFYKNALSSSIKLVGKASKGGRFGTAIATLGDIDLDTYNDIAISAPYEDDGMGAVYIFMGGKDGIQRNYHQRLTPSQFSTNKIKGFGLGLSRGNDVDGNGHNDLAVGAYKSGHVFIMKTKSVIDFHTILESNVTTITTNELLPMDIKYCIFYKPRSNTAFLKKVDFQMMLTLDYRVKGPKTLIENITAYPEITFCKDVKVEIEGTIVDILPFHFSLKTDTTDNVVGKGTKLVEKSIPYSHGCGSDNICQTQILLNVLTDSDHIVLGLDKEFEVKVSAENIGEPGYLCMLYIEIPNELDLKQEKQCRIENTTYICPFTQKLDPQNEKEIAVNFNVLNVGEVRNLELTFEVKCLGDNIENKESVNIAVIVENSPYLDGKSDPDDYEYNDDNANKDTEVEIVHRFTLDNFGPSPVKSDVYLLIPIVKINDESLFEFVEAKSNLRGIQAKCYRTNETKTNEKENLDLTSILKSSLNRSTVFHCFEEKTECLQLLCKADYLDKSSENAKYNIKFKVKNKLLAKFFENQDQSKNILTYISSAFLFNGTRIEAHAATLILSVHTATVAQYVYILASVLGILLLALVIYGFYKCHFFDRVYRDKMNDERLMDQQIEMDTGVAPQTETDTEIREDGQ